MATGPSAAEEHTRRPGRPGLASLHPDTGPPPVHSVAEPTAGMVLHRVLAMAARTFLLNDIGDELPDDTQRYATVDALTLRLGTRPLWAQSAAEALDGTQRRHTEVERIHQSRVALRRIRSNLRTFRLALDPAWGTALRAEAAWYADRLGEAHDLHIIREVVKKARPRRAGHRGRAGPRGRALGTDGGCARRHPQRAGEAPALPADRADDGPLGRPGIQAQGAATGHRGAPAPARPHLV